jgi:hypothetical protein
LHQLFVATAVEREAAVLTPVRRVAGAVVGTAGGGHEGEDEHEESKRTQASA